MPRLYLFIGLLVLGVYSWGQYRGIGLFDDFSAATPQRGGAARTLFHK